MNAYRYRLYISQKYVADDIYHIYNDNDNEYTLLPYIHRRYKSYRWSFTVKDAHLEYNATKNLTWQMGLEALAYVPQYMSYNVDVRCC